MKRLSVARHSAFWFSAGKSPVTLDDLCKVTGISKYHLIRLFQKHVGTTPGQYLRDQRLQLAEQLLRHSQKNILSIALESGFNSLSSFERAFGKKVWNQSVRVSQKVISLRLVFLLFWSHPRRVP
jgi:AraC-like DNA-binding protein